MNNTATTNPKIAHKLLTTLRHNYEVIHQQNPQLYPWYLATIKYLEKLCQELK